MGQPMADTQLIARQLLSDLKRDFGLTNEQAAGVVGNLMHESGGFQTLQEVNPTVPGSAGGFGFAQWTGDRRKNFDSYVEKQGLDRNSYQANYGFLKHELENDPYERRQFNTVKKATTAAEAARLVSENFLRPGVPHNASRVRYAEQILPFANMPVPPGELPEVATRQDTRRTPALPPVPVTSSPDMAMMRRAAAPSQLIRDSFAQLPRPAGNAGDSLAMSPVQGGRQQAPMFDAAYDERVGSMRPTRQPIDSQGMATGSSRPPAPVPASPFDRVTARMNALPPITRLPEVPPPAVGGAPTTRSVQSVPMVAPRMQVSASDMVRGRNGWETVASIPSTPPPTAFSASDMARGRGSVPPVIDRLGPSTPGLPALYGGFSPEQVAMIGVPAMPEIPGAPRTRMASAAPFPMPRPSFMPSVGTALSVQPMPPMPMARPMRQPVAQQQRRAPVPMPLAMRPQQAPLRIVVQRDQPQRQPAPAPVPQGFTSNGNGSITSNEYGSTYYSRHL